MSDRSPLGNIREQLDEAEKQKQDAEDAKVDQVPEQDKEEEDAESGPSFPFSEAKQSPLYPHRDRWEELEDAKFEMKVFLRNHSVKDVQGRELDDAILRYAVADPKAVAKLVLEARDLDWEADDD